MAHNHGKEDRKWRLWKEAEEKTMRANGIDEATIEQIRIDDRAAFNSDRRFHTHSQEVGAIYARLDHLRKKLKKIK